MNTIVQNPWSAKFVKADSQKEVNKKFDTQVQPVLHCLHDNFLNCAQHAVQLCMGCTQVAQASAVLA